MTIVRRVLLLVLISCSGIALLAPLAARSAADPVAPVSEEHLLRIDDGEAAQLPAINVDRGTLSGREGGRPTSPADEAEAIEGVAMPTPASAPMEATLYSTGTPPPPPPAAAAPAPATSSGSSVWDDLAQCESGGNWAINTGNGYYGGLQFSYDTWHGYGGGEFADYPHQASREEQIIVAERLRAVRGYAPWPACRDKLGLP